MDDNKYEVDKDKHEVGIISHTLCYLNRAFIKLRECRLEPEIINATSEIRYAYDIINKILIDRESKHKHLV